MKRLPVLILFLGAGFALAQRTEDLYNQVLVSRVVGKWKGHLHFDQKPLEFPADYYGTVEAKWTLGMHVEAKVTVDAPKGQTQLHLLGMLGSEDGLTVKAVPTHALNAVFFWDGESGYLPMEGELKNGKLFLEGSRLPKEANGKWRTHVDFKSRDEIDVTLLGEDDHDQEYNKPFGYIKFTRVRLRS